MDHRSAQAVPSAPPERRSEALPWVAGGVGVALLAYGVLGLLPLADRTRAFAAESLQTLLAAAALVALASAAAATRSDRRGRWAWGLMATAVATLLGARLLSVYFAAVGFSVSLAWARGFLYLAFYPLFFAAVQCFPARPGSPESRRRVLLDMGLTVASAALVLWILVLEPSLQDMVSTAGRRWTRVLPLGDLLLLWGLLELLFAHRTPTGERRRNLLAAGAGGLLLSDVVYTALMVRGAGVSGLHWASLLSAVGVGCLALGALSPATASREPGETAAKTLRGVAFGASLQLALLCLVGSFAVLVASHIDHISSVTVAALAVTTALAIWRQTLALRQSRRLQEQLHEARDALEERVAARTSELDLKLKEVTALRTVAMIAAAAEDEEDLAAEVTHVAKDALGPDYCGVALLDREARVLRVAASFYIRGKCADIPPIPLGKGVVGKVAVTGRAIRVDDVRMEPEYFAVDLAVRSELCVPIVLNGEVIGVFNAESVRPAAFTDSDERILEGLANQMAVAIGRLRAGAEIRGNEARFRALVQHSDDIVTVHTAEKSFAYQSPSLQRFLGYAPEALEGRNPLDFVHPDDMAVAKDAIRRTLKGETAGIISEFRFRRADGSWAQLETVATNLLQDPSVRGIVLTSRDVTRRKEAQRTIRQQLERLKALRAIDTAIGATSDLKHTLAVLLEQVTAQLGVDAADVLLLDPGTQTFSFAAGRGMRTDVNRHLHLHLGESFAGHAARDRVVVRVPDLLREPGAFARSALLREEMFIAYFAAPLITKNQVVGVLEVFHRSPMDPSPEWVEFLETLAGQAAIALDNSTLFENLQRSNAELALAYDVTLQGWSKALELRDQETLGHTERVVELTVRLCRAAGIPEADLLHVRRGALLHDIGKMGIPDGILLKPGPLNPDEWAVMKRHVDYARELLAPIDFLRPALAIPCGHHERWDGSGYPLGLRGEAIPLAARAFAVVDIWDALCFDRPYRLAWPPEKVTAYLREEAGRLLDPHLVELFLSLDPCDSLLRPTGN